MADDNLSKSGISVIVCCYNSEKVLPKTIEYLANQEVRGDIDWEIIIVNNASTDKTREIAIKEWSKYNRSLSFQVIDEHKAGLSNARRKGFDTSEYEYICYCDDDNWLSEKYVETAYNIMNSHSEIGVLGGKGEPVCEVSPEQWFFDNLIQYACGEQGDTNGDITNQKGYVYGAGMVIRKSVLKKIYDHGHSSFLTGRKKNVLTSGEDNELCYLMRMAGYKIWYNDSLLFKHFITKERLNWDYFLKLKYNVHKSDPVIKAYFEVFREFKSRDNKKLAWVDESFHYLKYIISIYKRNRNDLLSGNLKKTEQAKLKMYYGKLKGWATIRGGYKKMLNELLNLKEKIKIEV